MLPFYPRKIMVQQVRFTERSEEPLYHRLFAHQPEPAKRPRGPVAALLRNP
jgi:hypothetical protein